jgi:hypothetical protein
MKRVRLTEAELTNVIKRVISEDILNNKLYNDIMDVIRNSVSTNEEIITILKHIAREREQSMNLRNRLKSRWEK